tara:strand:+ start:13302 stop:13661 length:360 start_codon:yes stop_codon:yes gene_type:complete
MRLLVCGGRVYSDEKAARAILDYCHAETPITVIIEGGARGADSFARQWARKNAVPVATFPADWSQGPKGGPARNQKMVDEGQPDGAVAFPGGKGTADMVRRLKAADVPVWQPSAFISSK